MPAGSRRAERVTLPFEPGQPLPKLSGRLAFLRRFGRPTGVGHNERVWLVMEGTSGRIVLNQERLGDAVASEVARFDVTGRLAERNLLAIEAAISPAGDQARGSEESSEPTFPIGDVRLEIHAAM